MKLHIEGHSLCRLSSFQHGQRSLSLGDAQQFAKYLFGVEGENYVLVYYNIELAPESPFLALVAECEDSDAPLFLNYEIQKDLYSKSSWCLVISGCNTKSLQILDISQLRDSCFYVTVQYDGSGDYYLINRAGNNNPVDSLNINQEGIFLGM